MLMATAYLFEKMGYLHEVIFIFIGSSLYLVWLLGLPAVFLAGFSGAIRRTFSYGSAKLWLALQLWLFLIVPMSTWRGESLTSAISYLQVTFPLIFIIGGLPVTIQDLKRFVYAISLSTISSVLLGRSLSKTGSDSSRLELAIGSMGNSNDFAAHILFILPLLFLIVFSKSSWLLKAVSGLLIVFLLIAAAQSGSRGAMLAAGVGMIFVFLRGPVKTKATMIFLAPILVVALFASLPASLIERYSTIFTGDNSGSTEADESSRMRRYLFDKSIEYTLANPIFGVGTNQFPNVEGGDAKRRGENGVWKVTHNSYTQVSSETGLVGLILFSAALIATFRTFNRLYRLRFRPEPEAKWIASLAFYLMLSQLMYCFALIFLSLAYSPQLIVLAGLAIAMQRVADYELVQKKQIVIVPAGQRPVLSPAF